MTQAADRAIDEEAARFIKASDVNDVLYAVEASKDCDPGPGLETIRAALLAINSEDDLINPPELGILEREIGRVRRGKAIVIPRSDRTRGHRTHSIAAIWKDHLVELLKRSDRWSPATAETSRARPAGSWASADRPSLPNPDE